MPKIRSWVPNLFTLGNLSLGFFAILLCLRGGGGPDTLKLAGALILLAVLCDGLDGFAARLLNASSELGAQLDSLADLTAFGIAPGVLMYSLALEGYRVEVAGTNLPAGMFVGAVFPICAAYRLARFNVEHASDSFRGLPSPVAGIIIALTPLVSEVAPVPPVLLAVLFLACAFLMVSTLKYSKPQVSRRFTPSRLAVLVVFLVGALVFAGWRYQPAYSFVGLFFIIVVYVVSGVVTFLISLIQRYRV